MKKILKSILAIAIVLEGFGNIQAQEKSTKKEEFKAYGNCGMCKDRIEKATKFVDGVSSAKWSSKTEILKVTYDTSKTNIDKIQQAVADVGHDTDLKRADDKVYDNLRGCCKYDRPEKNKGEEENK